MDVTKAGDPSFAEASFGWLLTNWCNYSCSYCSSKGWLVDRADRSKYRAALMVPFRLKNIDIDFTVDLAGGEPTIHPYLNRIVRSLVDIDRCKKVVINTNLSRSIRYYTNLIKHEKVLVVASYHAEYDNQAFREKCLALRGDGLRVHINISDDAAHWQNTLDIINFCIDSGIAYGLNSLYSTQYKTIRYSPECYDTFKDLDVPTKGRYDYTFADGTTDQMTSFEIRQRGLHKFAGYRCRTMKYQIDFDGTFRKECNNERLHTMFPKRKDIDIPIVCARQQGCDCDVMLRYYKEIPARSHTLNTNDRT